MTNAGNAGSATVAASNETKRGLDTRDNENSLAKRIKTSSDVKPDHIILSESDDEQAIDTSNDLRDLLKEAMAAHLFLLLEHATLTKACRIVANLDPGADEKVKEAMQTIGTISTKKRITELIEDNNKRVDIVHEKGYARIFELGVKTED